MKILITGGTGFIGSHLVQRLKHTDHELIVISRIKQSNWDDSKGRCKVRFVYADLLNNFDFVKHTREVNIVVHLFWSNSPRNDALFLKQDLVNSVGVGIDLLDACVKNGVERVIFASSGGTVYGMNPHYPLSENRPLNPISSYGITKACFEFYLNYYSIHYGIEGVVLRLSNVYGPGQNLKVKQGVISHWIHDIINEQKIELWGDGKVIRDYIYISDVIDAITSSIHLKSGIWNISSNAGVSLKEIIDILSTQIGIDFEVQRKSSKISDVPVSVLDNELAIKEMNWSPQVKLEEGIRLTYNYIRKKEN